MVIFTVENLTKNDIPAVMSIAEQANLSRWSEKDLREELLLAESIAFKLSDASTECLGFVIGRIVPGFIRDLDAELYNIGIVDSARRKGGGSRLLERFITECGLKGAHNIWLDVRASNHPALSFYYKFGFYADGARKNFYSEPTEDAVLMRLELK